MPAISAYRADRLQSILNQSTGSIPAMNGVFCHALDQFKGAVPRHCKHHQPVHWSSHFQAQSTKQKRNRLPREACAPKVLPNPGQEQPFRIRWECEETNRYYEVHANLDVFGIWVLTKAWGRRGSALGNSSQHACESYADAVSMLDEVAVRRVKRQYIQSHVSLK